MYLKPTNTTHMILNFSSTYCFARLQASAAVFKHTHRFSLSLNVCCDNPQDSRGIDVRARPMKKKGSLEAWGNLYSSSQLVTISTTMIRGKNLTPIYTAPEKETPETIQTTKTCMTVLSYTHCLWFSYYLCSSFIWLWLKFFSGQFCLCK